MTKKMTESAKISAILSDLENSKKNTITFYLSTIKSLLSRNHFDEFFFDYDYKPQIILPLPSYGVVFDTDKQIILNINEPISQGNNEYFIWNSGQYSEVEVSSVKCIGESIYIKPILNRPYDKQRFKRDNIEMNKNGLINIETLPFPIEAMSNIVWNLLDELPKI